MGANSLFRQAKEYALGHAVVVDIRQKCPYTCVEVRCVWEGGGHEFYEYGFSKCRWPDVWDAAYGVELARKKAAADIARKLVGEGWTPAEAGD